MMITIGSSVPLNFQQNSTAQKRENRELLAYAACGAMLTPLIPLIDGDGLKETCKNRNIAKYVTGMAAVGGFFTASNLLLKNKFDNINDFKKMTCKALIGAVTLPLALLADNWARVGEKKKEKKWYGIAAITGAAIMCIASELVGCTKQAKK